MVEEQPNAMRTVTRQIDLEHLELMSAAATPDAQAGQGTIVNDHLLALRANRLRRALLLLQETQSHVLL